MSNDQLLCAIWQAIGALRACKAEDDNLQQVIAPLLHAVEFLAKKHLKAVG